MIDLDTLTREELQAWLNDTAKLWLAHDGLWFQAVEGKRGMEEAIEADTAAWSRFSPIEAKRIMKRLGMEPGGGLEALARALKARMYTLLNEDEIRWEGGKLIYVMKSCRVQSARKRRGLPDFPCKSVGIVEYTTFAETIDPRIRTRCITCPPDPHPEEHVCIWEFWMEEEGENR